MQFFIGLLMVAGGYMLVWKTEWLVSNFGSVYFFEKYLGTEGGSRLGYKLIGLFIIFIGFLTITGLIDEFLGWVFGPLIRATRMGQ